MPNGYDRGDLVRLSAAFLNASGVPGDPSSITLLTIDPSTTRATYAFGTASVTRATVGAYYMDITPNVTGQWGYRWEGTGGVQAVAETIFAVNPTFKL